MRNRITFNRLTILAIVVLTISPKLARSAELDEYGGYTAIKGKATGFFHIEEIDGRNWFVTPSGNVFFAVALSHVFSEV